MASNRNTQTTEAYEKLRWLLVTLQVPAGQRLVEMQWAQRLEVNRAALREAMSLLAHEGLLRRGERGGHFVPVLDDRDREELMQLRLILESGAMRIIGAHGPTRAERDKLSAACEDYRIMIERGLFGGCQEADMRFHEAMVGLSGNIHLIDTYRRSSVRLLPYTVVPPPYDMKVHANALTEHRQIQSLLWERQMPEALARLEHHLHVETSMTPWGGATERADRS